MCTNLRHGIHMIRFILIDSNIQQLSIDYRSTGRICSLLGSFRSRDWLTSYRNNLIARHALEPRNFCWSATNALTNSHSNQQKYSKWIINIPCSLLLSSSCRLVRFQHSLNTWLASHPVLLKSGRFLIRHKKTDRKYKTCQYTKRIEKGNE